MSQGEHIVASPKNVAEFVHATALSMQQLLTDMKASWGVVEMKEFGELMRNRLALTPDNHELISFCHAINLAWAEARQAKMQNERFPSMQSNRFPST